MSHASQDGDAAPAAAAQHAHAAGARLPLPRNLRPPPLPAARAPGDQQSQTRQPDCGVYTARGDADRVGDKLARRAAVMHADEWERKLLTTLPSEERARARSWRRSTRFTTACGYRMWRSTELHARGGRTFARSM
jgi:hypothetical protein